MKVLKFTDVAIIILSLIAAVFVALGEGFHPWWLTFFWLFVLILSRIEPIHYREDE